MSLPRLLRGAGRAAMSYEQHRRVHGELPSASRRRIERGPSLMQELTRSGLRGRGGGGFPLAGKLDAVHRARGTPVVVVNGCEGEPMSAKDRTLLRSVPHLVLDGALCCARTLGATEIMIAMDELSVGGKSVRGALAERAATSRELSAARVAELPPGYVSGEETAVVAFLNRGIAKPTYVPARVSRKGVAGRPTLVSNAETLAHAALIARHGAAWFCQVGASSDPGSMLVTLGGSVIRPGVYEIESGCSLGWLLDAAGGLTEPAQAFLFGGYAGAWVDVVDVTTVGLSREGLRQVGGNLGAGVVVALPQSACAVAEITRVAGWMAAQGSGQCGPCINGLAAIAGALERTRQGDGGPAPLRDVRRWAAQVVGRGACAHPDGAARFVTSGLAVFAEEFDDHARYGACDACDSRPVLATPGNRA